MGSSIEQLLAELQDNPRFQKIQQLNPKFKEVKPRKAFESFAAEKIYEAIHKGTLEYKGHKLDLLDTEKFTQQLQNFLQETDKEFFNEEILRELHLLTLETHDSIKTIVDSTFANFEKDLFDYAIECSKAGKPIVLDVIPDTVDGKSLVERFEEYCISKQHHCPTYTALVHLPIRELTERMKHRNAEAIARDEPSDQRLGSFPFRQLSQIVEPRKHSSEGQVIGSITRADLDYAMSQFSELNRDDLSVERREFFEKKEAELRQKFGFDKAAKEGEESIVELVAIPPFDQVFDLTAKESTALVAAKICALATDRSLTPDKESPVAKIIREKAEYGDREESFVKRLGLKPTKTRTPRLPSHVDILREKFEQQSGASKPPERHM